MIAPPLLVFSVRLLALTGAMSLAVSGECQPLFLAMFGGMFILGWMIHGRHRLTGFLNKGQAVLALFSLGVAIVDFLALSNSFLLTVAHFLLMIQGLRLLALQTSRENLGSVLLSSLMVLSAATLSVDWTYFALLLVFIGMVIWTLMLHTLLDEARRHAAPNAFLIPLEKMVRPVRRAALAAFFVALLCCVIVFIVFPRFNFQGFRGQFLQPVKKTGFTSSVDLSGGGDPIFEDNSIAMRIEIAPSQRAIWTGYVRGQALTEFHNGGWRRPPGGNPVRVFRTRFQEMNVAPRVRHEGPFLKQRVYLESMETPLLFAAPLPSKFVIDRPFVDVNEDDSVQRLNGDAWRVRYDAESYRTPLDPSVAREMYGEASIPPSLVARATGARTIEELASVLSAGENDARSKTLRMSNYLQNNYGYALREGTSDKKGLDALNEFLFDSKQGHCEYFASALCLMLRSQNIPARVVTGFLSREWNNRGNYVVVRMKHAHAWVEAQVSEERWIGIDPSPRTIETTRDVSSFWGQWTEAMDYLNLRWNRYVLSYDFERQVSLVQKIVETGSLSRELGRWRRWTVSIKAWTRREDSNSAGVFTMQMPPSSVVFISVVVAFLLGGLVWRGRRRGTSVWFYARLVRALEREARSPLGSQTLREFRSKHADVLGPNAPLFDDLIALYYEHRFSGHPPRPAQMHRLHAALASLRKNAR